MNLGIYVIGLILLVLAGVSYVYAHRIAEKQLKQRFVKREAIPFDEWFRKYYGSTKLSKELVQDVLNIIASQIGIIPTQIRPDDRFDDEFRFQVKYRFLLIDDATGMALEHIFKKYTSSIRKIPSFETVDDLIHILANIALL